LIVLILLLAFALRVYAMDAQPLRGDEAFAIRYWAQPPAVILEQLAWIEPHPYGTFFSFWAWKMLAGDSELAMRLLPALLNLLGVAGIYALALRLRMGRAAALLAALLWAVNPNLIWHSQDARNYAAWAGMSVVALWLLLRALERNRRFDWLLYVVIEALTLYVFFLEAFLLVVHVLVAVVYQPGAKCKVQSAEFEAQSSQFSVLSSPPISEANTQNPEPRTQNMEHGNANPEPRTQNPERRTQNNELRTRHSSLVTRYSLLLPLLLPWLYQVYQLAGSGYGGTAAGADVGILLRDFVPELMFGERLSAFGAALPGAFITLWVLIAVVLWDLATRARAAWLALLLLIVPTLLLFVVSTRVDVFRPRYIIAITPALILLLVSVVTRGDGGEVNVGKWTSRWASLRPTARVMAGVLLLVTLLISYDALETYYTGGAPKAPDWRALGSYLDLNADAMDTVVLIGVDDSAAVDPAFMYYYGGAFEVLPQPDEDTLTAAAALLMAHETVYLVHAGSDPPGVEAAFDASAQAIGGQALRGFRVMVYGGGQANPMQPLSLSMGGGQLAGWRMVGVPRQGDTIWLLLDWAALPEARWKTFVHLRNNEGAVVSQVDQYPASGNDVYALSLLRVPAGLYMLHIGVYDEATGERAPITAADGAGVGDSALLTAIEVAPGDE
jgi:4-amino-4-deoxy-L-arabinose transferase-like glycosyltransferase